MTQEVIMEHDLTTPDGFAAMMREKEGNAAAPESQDGTEGAAATEEVVAPPEPAEGAAPPEGEEKPDDFAAGYARALGEQSEKLGQERAAREALEQRLAELERGLEETPPAAVTDETWDRLETLYDNQGGAGMMFALASDPTVTEEMLDAGIALWKESDFRNAELYEKKMMRLMESSQEGTQQQEGTRDPRVDEIVERDANRDATEEITREYGRERLETIQPHLEDALKAAPQRLREVLAEDFQSADKDRIVGAFRTLVTLAEPLAAATGTSGSSASAKQAATVASGSQARSGQGESELPSTREELEALAPDERKLAAKKLMTQRILGQETSLARELSKNSK